MNQQPSLKRYVKSIIKSENQQDQHHLWVLLLLSMRKKGKEGLRTRLSGKKLLELKHFLDQYNLSNEKPPEIEEL